MTPEQRAEYEAIREATEVAHALRMARAAQDFAESLRKQRGKWKSGVLQDWLYFLDSLAWLADLDRLEAERVEAQNEMGIDAEGYELDESGFQAGRVYDAPGSLRQEIMNEKD